MEEAVTKEKAKQINKETQEKLKKVGEFLKTSPLLKDQQGQLMGALHYVQTLFGYLPQEAMEYISEKLSIPTAHIYGMATFYNYFSLQPKARYQIYLCKGTACYVAGGARIQERLREELRIGIGETTPDGMFGVNITRCLGFPRSCRSTKIFTCAWSRKRYRQFWKNIAVWTKSMLQ